MLAMHRGPPIPNSCLVYWPTSLFHLRHFTVFSLSFGQFNIKEKNNTELFKELSVCKSCVRQLTLPHTGFTQVELKIF